MDWRNHPRHRAACARLASALQSTHIRKFRKLRNIVFLCGGATQAASRHVLRDYLNSNSPDSIVFYADDVWFDLSERAALNALEAENWLARLADIVIIVVESPGAIAELGAFSMSGELRRKLLPIIDRNYLEARSFIMTGPVSWVDKDSGFAPAVFVALDTIAQCAGELEERLSRIERPPIKQAIDVVRSPKHLLFLLCDLVAITGPVTADAISDLVGAIVKQPITAPMPMLLSLAAGMDLIQAISLDGQTYYIGDVSERAFLRQRFFHTAQWRADYLGTMTGVPAFVSALRRASEKADAPGPGC